MNELLTACFDILFISIELTMMAVILNSVNRRKVKWPVVVISLLVWATAFHLLSYLYAGNQLIRMSVNAILMMAWSKLCFSISFTKCVFVVVFCLAYYNLADMAFIITYTELAGIDVPVFLENMYNYVSFSILVKLAELLGVIILHVWIKHNTGITYAGAGSWILTLIYPAASVIVGIYMIKVVTDFPDSSVDVFISMVVVLFTDLMSICLANYLERQRIDVHNSVILRASMKAELENVHTWQDAYAQQRKITHEYNNQLAVIKGMVEQGNDPDTILAYIDQLKNLPDASKYLVSTGRPVADIVINQKLSIANSKNIDFSVQPDDLSSVKLPDYALVVILTNIIDNAIKAAEKVSDETKRKISLKIKVVDDVTFLNIVNYTEFPVIIKNNKVVTSKADRMKHGYGLINVSSIVSQYGGFYTLGYDEEQSRFSVSVQI